MGAGIFALLGAADEVADAAVWLSFLIAGVVAGLQGYSFAKLGAWYPSAGGLLEYVAKSTGKGHFTGITAWLTFVFTTLIHEPASIATLAGTLLLSVALDYGWKQFRDTRKVSSSRARPAAAARASRNISACYPGS
ncbi:MAG: hypothetical protein ACLPQY_29725 [Streptosporangiaceae bacterium]